MRRYTTDEKIAHLLKQDRLGMKACEYADHAGINRSTYYRWHRGSQLAEVRRNPKREPFMAMIREGATAHRAAVKLDIDRRTAYRWLQESRQ